MLVAPLIHQLYDINAIQFGEFTLKSGAISPIYINLRKIISYPALMQDISEIMWAKAKSLSFDLICGVPYTALPIATCMSITHNIPMVMRRKEKKDYGTKQTVEGVFKSGQTVLIIEDVITSGASVLETTHELKNHDLVVTDVIAVLDRNAGGRENLEKHYRLHTLFDMSTLYDTLLSHTATKPEDKRIIETLSKARIA